MNEDWKCPECGAKDLFFKKVHKRMPTWQQVMLFVSGLLMIYLGIRVGRDTGALYPLVGILIGIFLLWGAYRGRTKPLLTSISFKCGECTHQWDVETQGMSHARKWQELPSTEWQKVVSGEAIPGLGK